MTRKQALEIIKVEYRQHGKLTAKAMQVYVENRISHKVLMQVIGRVTRT